MQQTQVIPTIAEVEISYKSKVPASQRQKVSSSSSAEQLLRSFWKDTLELREEFYILLLNRSNQVLGFSHLSTGGISGTVVDPRLVFVTALKCHASALIVAHNHPSGTNKPSEADIRLTKNLVEGGKILEIQVLDHIILTTENYYSFADEGMI